MEPSQARTRRAMMMVCSMMLASCASTPAEKDDSDLYGMLYDGESTAAYGTEFPVDNPAEAYRSGDRAAQAGDLDRALYEYVRGLRLEDEPPADPLYSVGSIHYRRGNHRMAETAYRMALDADPDHGRAGTGLGLVQLETRQYQAAERQLRAVADNGNASWRTHNALGILADLRQEFDEALGHYEHALADTPENPVVLNNLGYSRYLAADWEGAHQALRRALRIDPDYDRAWRNLGLVHIRQRNYDDALDAVRRSGTEAEAYNDVGYVSMLEGRYSEAVEFFQKAMRLSPTFYVTASENAKEAQRKLLRAARSESE